jgi:hypothetical protein
VKASDSQQVELIGTSLLEAELVRNGFEVAHPNRDRGIDLLIYRDAPDRPFAAVPVQIKASTSERFDLDSKYGKFFGLVFAYIWNVNGQPQIFLLTYAEAFNLLGDARKTKSWTEKGYYAWTNFVSADRKKKLGQFADRWDWLHRHLDSSAVAG